jgi:glycolate oxidase subunit GlcD
MALELRRDLSEMLGPEAVLQGQAVSRAYDCDAYTVDKSSPQIVVLPNSTAQVAEVVAYCCRHYIPFTPRGAGTGLSGGSLPAKGGVVISTKRLNKILEIDLPNRRMKAQTGVANKRLSDAVAEHGLHFAPDPSSQSVATLGGNISENSGGPHTLKYGVTAQHILSVTLVSPTGEVLEIGGSVPGGPGYNLLGAVIGAEGTMGIVTEAWINLTPIPKAVKTALAAFPHVRGATESVAAMIASGVVPAALEIMDRGILKALHAAFGLTYPEGTAALLLVECDSSAPDSAEQIVEAEMTQAAAICAEKGALDVSIAQTDLERQKLWNARKKGIGAMGRLAPTIVTHDGVIPRSKLPEMLEFVEQVAARYGIGVANLFHAGDGNLHPCFYFDDRDPRQVEAVIEAGEEIMRRCVALGGSITGEHGIGVEKLDLMSLMFSDDDLEAQERVKRILNDGELCNPCKVLPNQKSCVEHQRRWRGVAW